MKHLTILSIVLLMTFQSIAQTSRMIASPNKKFEKYRQFTMNVLKQQSVPAAKTTTKTERLVGGSYNATMFRFGNLYDSTVYVYNSKSRGSHFDLDGLQYNFSQAIFDYQVPMIYTPFSTSQVGVLCDTFYGSNYDSIADLVLANTVYSSYDVNNNLVSFTSEYADTTYNPDVRDYNGYNADGNITLHLSFSMGTGGKWDSSSKRIFGYNASKQLITDSTYAYNGSGWTPSNVYTYSYDGS